MQKKAARIILRQPRDAHTEPLLNQLELVSLAERRQKHIIKMVLSAIEGRNHPAIIDMVNPLPDGSLRVPESLTTIGRRRFQSLRQVYIINTSRKIQYWMKLFHKQFSANAGVHEKGPEIYS